MLFLHALHMPLTIMLYARPGKHALATQMPQGMGLDVAHQLYRLGDDLKSADLNVHDWAGNMAVNMANLGGMYSEGWSPILIRAHLPQAITHAHAAQAN